MKQRHRKRWWRWRRGFTLYCIVDDNLEFQRGSFVRPAFCRYWAKSIAYKSYTAQSVELYSTHLSSFIQPRRLSMFQRLHTHLIPGAIEHNTTNSNCCRSAIRRQQRVPTIGWPFLSINQNSLSLFVSLLCVDPDWIDGHFGSTDGMRNNNGSSSFILCCLVTYNFGAICSNDESEKWEKAGTNCE